MEFTNEQLLEEWFTLTEEELVDVFLSEDSSEEQIYNAIVVIQEKYDLSEEELYEFIDTLKKYGTGAIDYLKKKAQPAIDYGKEKVKEKLQPVIDKVGPVLKYAKENPIKSTLGTIGLAYLGGKAVGNVIDAAKNARKNIGNQMSLTSGSGKIMNMDQLFQGSDAKKKKDDDEEETKTSGPEKPSIFKRIFSAKKETTPVKKESYSGETKMQKTFTHFREELREDIFIEDLDNENLFFVLESEEFDDESKKYAILELIEREEIEITEEIANFLNEAEPSFWDKYVNTGSDYNRIKNVQQKLGVKADGVVGPETRNAWKSKKAGDWGFEKKTSDLINKPSTSAAKTVTYQGGRGAQSRTVAAGSAPTSLASSGKTSVAAKALEVSPVNKTPSSKPSSKISSPTSSVKSQTSSKSSSVLKQQKALIAKGAKIKADGIMGPKTAAAQKQFGSKPASSAPVKKAIPSSNKPSAKMNDLRQSVDKLRGATSAAANATNRAKTALSKVPGTGKMNKPTSRGGMNSKDIHSAIGKLGGEPTRSTPKALPQTKQGAPRASSSRPPAGGKWIGASAPSNPKTKDLF